MTKEISEITSMDMANVMGSFISTELDAFENLHNELEERDKEIEKLNELNNRLYVENCKLREQHNITDVSLLDENYRLNTIIKRMEKYLDSLWLDDKGIVLKMRERLQELKGEDKECQ